MARPKGTHKRSKEMVDLILKGLRDGYHVETVCGFVGIDKGTFYNWVKEDKIFSTQVVTAKNEAIMSLATEVRKKDPQGAWKILKNLASHLYRDRIETEVTGKDGAPLTIIVKNYEDKKDEPTGSN